MTHFQECAIRVAIAAATLAAGAALAAPPQTVDITAQKPRFDVQTLCPTVADELPDALARAWQDSPIGGTAMVTVQFTLNRDRVGDVTTLDGPATLQQAVRRAVRINLQCQAAEASAQLVQFRVRFVDRMGSDPAQASGLVNIVTAGR